LIFVFWQKKGKTVLLNFHHVECLFFLVLFKACFFLLRFGMFFLFAKVSPKEMAIYVSNETYITQVDSPEAVLSLVQMVTLFKLSL
jgi:hypothetical protein